MRASPASPTSSGRFIISDSLNTAKGWRFATDQTGVFNAAIYTSSGSAGFTSASPANQATGVWKHVAMTYTPNGALTIYLGGLVAGSNTPAPAVIEDTVAATLIGCRAGANYLDATLDDLRIYSRALSGGEIAALAQ